LVLSTSFRARLRLEANSAARPERHEPRAHHDQAAFTDAGIVADDGERVGRRYGPTRGDVGVGRCGRIDKTSLISLTSEERRARPHMAEHSGAEALAQAISTQTSSRTCAAAALPSVIGGPGLGLQE
jgi:hypothetical protein